MNNRIWTYQLILLLAFIGTFSTIHAAGDNKAVASLDTNEVLIGDWIELTLEVSLSKNESVLWPIIDESIEVDSARYLELLDISEVDTADLGVQYRFSRIYTFTIFDTGYYVIPPFQVQFQAQDSDKLTTAASEPLLLSVYGLEIDTSQAIKPIKDPMDMPFRFVEIRDWLIIGGVVALLMIGILYFFMTRKRIEKPVVIKREPERPPHLIALEQLDRLESRKLWQNDEVKEYHSELSEILREYLENRYQILALESTTDELLDRMSRITLDERLRENLTQVLQLADFVKFAKMRPLPDEHTRSMKLAYEFIRGTILVEPTNQEETV